MFPVQVEFDKWLVRLAMGFWGLGLGPYDPLNPFHGGVSALDAAGVAGGGWCGGHGFGLFCIYKV
jgi:hypothetical protein